MITHWLNNPDNDAVNQRINHLGFTKPEKRVHVIYVPCYLNGSDGIFNIGYYDLLPGADASIFPSYYEPWGYTPLESTAFGVPTVTTDKAGFGQWVLDNFKNGLRYCGVYVVSREDLNYLESRDNIAKAAADYYNDSSMARSEARHAAFLTAEKADWQYFIKYYDEAFSIAIRRAAERIKI